MMTLFIPLGSSPYHASRVVENPKRRFLFTVLWQFLIFTLLVTIQTSTIRNKYDIIFRVRGALIRPSLLHLVHEL